jgi:hypothetical protein
MFQTNFTRFLKQFDGTFLVIIKMKLNLRYAVKKMILITAALFMIIALRLDAKPDPGISFDFFYSSLQPYGEWIQFDNDLVVWKPNGIHSHWRPYMEGRWSWTENGWYWDSYEPFGWATYHYGRWFNDDYYGWIWIPDYEWGPSWVEWRYDDDYIGWAPLPPYALFNINFGIHFSIGWHSNYNYWNFVSYHRFCDRRLNYYLLDNRHSERIFGGTKYRTNYFSNRDRIINGGVDKELIERKAGYRINEREISRVDNHNDYDRLRSDKGDRIVAYRPSDREIGNARSDERFEIKRGENRTTLDRSKIPQRMRDERTGNVSSDRTVERNRDINSDRSINRNENNNSSNVVRERNRIETPSIENRNPNRSNTRSEERVNRNIQREKPQTYDRPSRSERSYQMERPSQSARRQEVQRSPNVERSSPRTERNTRSESKSESRSEKQSERSSERRR